MSTNSYILGFNDFINEELDVMKSDGTICSFEYDWFYYNQEDDIIYGCNDKPVGENSFFAFNPTACTIIIGGKEKNYDVNNPVCLIRYNMDEEMVTVYTDDYMQYLNELGFKGNDIESQQGRNSIMDIFEMLDDKERHILISGNKLIASTFDVIEEE